MASKSAKSGDDASRNPTLDDLRAAIVGAEADGTAAGDMVLRLTFRDAALLKRSPVIGVHEISFSDGEMSFLGVKVVVGSVTVSALDTHPVIAV